jgi:hypothetical protein
VPVMFVSFVIACTTFEFNRPDAKVPVQIGANVVVSLAEMIVSPRFASSDVVVAKV